jgi:peptide/nickel transport system substrate-binding protein
MRRTKQFRMTAVLATLFLVVVACGGETNDDPEGTADTAGDTDEPDDQDGVDSPDGEPQTGGRLIIGVDAESPGLDPAFDSNGRAGQTMAAAIFDTLTAASADLEYEPFLIENAEPNEDATEWTVTLREGMVFHDGEPIDAEALAANLNRFMTEDAPNRSPLLESVEVVDDLTVTIHANRTWASFKAGLGEMWIASPAALEEHGDEFGQQPVGSGPYKLESWSRDDRMILQRFEDYWRDDVGYLDEIEIRPIPDGDARSSALRAGDIDMMFTQSGQHISEFLENDSFQVHEFVEGVNNIFLNTDVAPLDDLRVRQALAHAIDRERMIQIGWEGVGAPAYSAFPEQNPFHVNVETPEHDPDQARALIEEYEAETGQPVEFELTVMDTPEHAALNQLLQAMWQEVGADVSLASPVDYPTAITSAATGEFQAILHQTPGFFDPDAWMYNLHHSQSPINIPNHFDDDIDDAIERGQLSTDPQEREEAYADLQRLIAEQIPTIYIRENVNALIAQPYVGGLGEWTLPDGTPGYGQSELVLFMSESLWRAE